MKSTIINKKRIFAFSSKEELLESINGVNTILISMNAESILNNNSNFIEIVNRNIAFSDGIGSVIALKNKGFNKVTKIAGVELWLDIIKENVDKKIYLIGAKKDVIEKVVKRLKKTYKSLNIVGYHDGYLNHNKFFNIEEDILEKKPDIVFIAMGQPKQELIAERLFYKHKALYMGVGGSFDIYSGIKKRAPKIFLDLHLEWLYRLIKEPMRIIRQRNLIKFMFLLKMNRI